MTATVSSRRRAPANSNRACAAVFRGQRKRRLLHGTSKVKVHELADQYLADADSPFHSLRYSTRLTYRRQIARVVRDIGDREINDMKARDFKAIHADWISGGTIGMGHQLVTTFKIQLGFGAGILEDEGCLRLKTLLSVMKFPNSKGRSIAINEEQVLAVCEQAERDGFTNIALGQAAQWSFAFRQKDVIGEYVPADDPTPGVVINDKWKWVRGLHRGEFKDGVLTHVTSKKQKPFSIELAYCPLFLKYFCYAPKDGPLVIDWATGQPYQAWKYRIDWRTIARRAGVPDNVLNMDTRSGRATKLFADGAQPDDVRKFLTHSQLSTTMRYSRGDDEAIARAAVKSLLSGSERRAA